MAAKKAKPWHPPAKRRGPTLITDMTKGRVVGVPNGGGGKVPGNPKKSLHLPGGSDALPRVGPY